MNSVDILREQLKTCDAVVIGAGAGLSTSAGYVYSGERFKQNFADFEKKYGFTDMYSGGFYPYDTLEEQWAYWCAISISTATCPYLRTLTQSCSGL